MNDYKMVVAETPDRGRMWYLVNAHLDFVPEVKQFLDWKQATKHAPATIKSYCSRLLWLYRFLASSQVEATAVSAAHLTEFVIWLQFPVRSSRPIKAEWATQVLSAGSINDTVEVVAMFYRFLARRDLITQSPIVYVDGYKGKWAIERDLLAHTRRGSKQPHMELRVKELVNSANVRRFLR